MKQRNRIQAPNLGMHLADQIQGPPGDASLRQRRLIEYLKQQFQTNEPSYSFWSFLTSYCYRGFGPRQALKG